MLIYHCCNHFFAACLGKDFGAYRKVKIMYEFKLYTLSEMAGSQAAVTNIKRYLEKHLHDKYVLTIIDILESPESAIADKIFMTPTLIKVSPKPERKIIGRLDNVEKVLAQLELNIKKLIKS